MAYTYSAPLLAAHDTGTGIRGLIDDYAVQNSADEKRLFSDGLPWSTDPHRANLGDGVYAWSSKEDAINFFNKSVYGKLKFKH